WLGEMSALGDEEPGEFEPEPESADEAADVDAGDIAAAAGAAAAAAAIAGELPDWLGEEEALAPEMPEAEDWLGEVDELAFEAVEPEMSIEDAPAEPDAEYPVPEPESFPEAEAEEVEPVVPGWLDEIGDLEAEEVEPESAASETESPEPLGAGQEGLGWLSEVGTLAAEPTEGLEPGSTLPVESDAEIGPDWLWNMGEMEPEAISEAPPEHFEPEAEEFAPEDTQPVRAIVDEDEEVSDLIEDAPLEPPFDLEEEGAPGGLRFDFGGEWRPAWLRSGGTGDSEPDWLQDAGEPPAWLEQAIEDGIEDEDLPPDDD
ncbi:MAG: hypothetical protein JXN59_02835, partial [Anaerolineae bacterium]|nr:hypothetical protein [Anaerolineae bacterium]